MRFPWQKNYEALRTAPFPEAWREHLERNVPHYALLSEAEQETLRGDLRIFIEEKHWEGCAGLELTQEMRVTIAAQACILTLCLPQKHYPNVLSIFVYPQWYAAEQQTVGPGGIVTEGVQTRLGEAWRTGPVVLSWADVVSGARNREDARNVVFHEFAHKLDLMDGEADGFPRLHDSDAYDRWREVLTEEWRQLIHESQHGHQTLLDPYGATNAAELFAVATETFFEQPLQMRHRHPRLYEVLREFYRQDPAERVAAVDSR